MKRLLPAVMLSLFLGRPAPSTAQTAWFGYFESNADYFGLPRTHYLLGYHKLRVDLDARPNEQLHLGANVNIQRYWGQTKLTMYDFLTIDTIHWSNQGWTVGSSLYDNLMNWPIVFRDTMYLDNYYLTWESDRFSITLGKQQLSFGSGYAWNPTDLFNYKDVLDPAYEQTGVTAVRGDVQLGLRTRLTLVIQPGASVAETGRFLQFKTGVGSFDVAWQYHQVPWQFSTLEMLRYLDRAVLVPVEHPVQRQMVGLSYAGELLGLGWHGELAWNHLYRNSLFNYDFTEALAGWDYTTTGGTTLMLELFHNESGAPAGKYYDLLYGWRYFNREIHSYHQNYAFVNWLTPWRDSQLGAFLIADLDDQSWLFSPTWQHDWSSVTLQLFWMLSRGKPQSEFGMLDYQVRLRLKAYF